MFKRIKSEETMPVTLDELRDWNYIDDHTFDNKLRLCLRSAVAMVESYINSIVWPGTFSLSLDHIAPIVPVSLYPVTSISVLVDGEPLAKALYSFDGHDLRLADAVTGDSMEVLVEAGNEEVDEDVKTAILLVASEFFRNPTDSVKQLPTASQQILNPHRRANI